MIAGAIDINATAPTPFLIGLDKGVPYTSVAVNSMICAANHIVALKSSDINSVSQLRGKKIGLPKARSPSTSSLSRVAPSYGLKPGDFQVANIPDPKDMHAQSDREGDRRGLARRAVQRRRRARRDAPGRRGLLQVRSAPVHADGDATRSSRRTPTPWWRTCAAGCARSGSSRRSPRKAAAVYVEDQKSLGREMPVAVIDKALQRMQWEPDLTPQMEKYLVDQAKDLAVGRGRGRINTMPRHRQGAEPGSPGQGQAAPLATACSARRRRSTCDERRSRWRSSCCRSSSSRSSGKDSRSSARSRRASFRGSRRSCRRSSASSSRGILPLHALETLLRLAAGFLLGAVVGVTMGMLMGRYRWAEDLLVPVVSVGNPIPGLAYAPLFVLWFGLGNLPAVLLVGFCRRRFRSSSTRGRACRR